MSKRWAAISSLAVLVLAIGGWQSCAARRQRPPSEFDNFVAATKRAETEGWTPYWLGRSFRSKGVTFIGPGVADFGAEIQGGGIRLDYAASLEQGGATINILIYSPGAWQRATELGGTRPPVGATPRSIKLAGRDAVLYAVYDRNYVVQGLRVDVIAEDGVVISALTVRANEIGGGNGNPLTDESSFLWTLDNLRPYPQ